MTTAEEASAARPAVHALVRANNTVWSALYYDELVETPDYQLTFMRDADAGFYNCAQAVARCDARVLDEVATFYRRRAAPPAVYVDPESPDDLIPQLTAAGYAPVEDELENCHLADLDDPATARAPDSALRVPRGRVELIHVTEPRGRWFDAFLDVDGTASGLSPAVLATLARKLRAPRRRDVELHCFLALVGGEPAATHLVGLHDGLALFAEAATLERFRRLGLYSYLLLEGLAFARGAGQRYAFQTAAHTAHSNRAAEKLGFERVCSRQYFRSTIPLGAASA